MAKKTKKTILKNNKQAILIIIGILAVTAAITAASFYKGNIFSIKPEVEEEEKKGTIQTGSEAEEEEIDKIDQLKALILGEMFFKEMEEEEEEEIIDVVQEVDTSDWVKYSNQWYGFEVKYPKDWNEVVFKKFYSLKKG